MATVARGVDALSVSSQGRGSRRWGGTFIVRGLQKVGFPTVFETCQMMQQVGRDGKSSSQVIRIKSNAVRSLESFPLSTPPPDIRKHTHTFLNAIFKDVHFIISHTNEQINKT